MPGHRGRRAHRRHGRHGQPDTDGQGRDVPGPARGLLMLGEHHPDVVNRDADHAVPASVDLPGRRVTDPIDVSTVNGASVESYNTPDHPQDISLHTAKEATDQGALQHSFAPHSVTLLT